MYRFLTNLPGVLEIDVVATESVNTLGGWSKPHKVRVISETGWEEVLGALKPVMRLGPPWRREHEKPPAVDEKIGPDSSTSSWTSTWEIY